MREQDLTPTPPNDHQVEATAPDIRSAARRRWILRAGVTVAPVVLTLASRPVLAGGQCISASATASMAASHASQQIGTCSGNTCSYWKTAGTWPCLKSLPFHNVFTVGAVSGRKFLSTTGVSIGIGDVMQLGTSVSTQDANGNFDQDGVASHIIAAYLNILNGTISTKAMTLERLQALWREWALTGQYTPYAGAKAWNSTAIKAYLTNNKMA